LQFKRDQNVDFGLPLDCYWWINYLQIFLKTFSIYVKLKRESARK